jgi:hypothetical protein
VAYVERVFPSLIDRYVREQDEARAAIDGEEATLRVPA